MSQNSSHYIEANMLDLTGKKLLILGGDALSADIVRAARAMGVHTTVLDWHSLGISPAKKIADAHSELSIKDYPAVVRYIKDNDISGVITGFTDSYLEPYAEICKLTGLPCYATKEQFELSLNKEEFKNICRSYGVPVVPEYDLDTILRNGSLPCPRVILKPIDNSGSRGIILVDDINNLRQSVEESLQFSNKKKILIEQYMDSDDVSMCYTIQDGKISLSAICDRYIHKTEQFGSVTSGLIYPSRYLSRYISEVNEKIKAMLAGIGLKNGVLFLQAFVDNKGFYFYEMGYRLSGGRHYVFTENQNGISAVKCLINFAITGMMDDHPIMLSDCPNFNNICSQLSILCKSEKISKIDGFDKLRNNPAIIDTALRYNVGDTVGAQGTTMQILARIHIVAKDVEDLQKILKQVRDDFHVYDESGNEMIIDFFAFDEKLYKSI